MLYTIPNQNSSSYNTNLISSSVSLVNGIYWVYDIIRTSSGDVYSDPGAIINPDNNNTLSNQVHVSGDIVNLSQVGSVYTIVYNDPQYVSITNGTNTATIAYRQVTIVSAAYSSGDPFITPLIL